MSLGSGTRLGPYEILALLGAGGMGVVYKARDTRLDRTVAIKVLPPDVAADADRRARFAREARAIAALSHPHICALYDIGQAVLPDPESRTPPAPSERPVARVEGSPITVDYLVMEYLEGETLAARLVRSGTRSRSSGPSTPPGSTTPGTPAAGPVRRGTPLPLDETLRIGTELAEALAAAHKAGIIHRDLKPGNVMLTPSGTKVLDFGLARLRTAEAASDATAAATRTAADPRTDAGTRLGTIPYMAPEQVEGKDADARSDVFALGAVLYEMATGHRAFEGETAASVAAAILDREPPPLTTTQPLTPPAFEHVVSTCLAKDPDARWQAAGDVAREMRWIADEQRLGRRPAGGLSSDAAAVLTATRTRRVKRTLALATVGLALVGAAAGVAWIVTRTSQVPGRPVHFWIDPRPAEHSRHGSAGGVPNPLARGRPNRPLMAVAPNGETLAFVAASENQPPQIYLRHEGGVAAQPLPGTEDAVSPIFSPDGRSIAYWSRGNWRKMPIDGRSHPVSICPSGPPFGASWAPDGTTLIFAEEWGPLLSVSASDATPRALTQVPPGGEESHRLPHLLPNGRGVLFTVLDYSPFSIADWEAVRVEVLIFATRERKLLLRGAVDARYLPTGHLLYARRGSLEAVPFDLARLEVTGAAFGVLPDVMQSMNTGNTTTETGAAQVALSPAGTLAYLAGGVVPLPDLCDFMWIDRTGPAPREMRVVLNWFEELKAKVSAGK